MDLAAGAAAASQISSAQRAQQVSIAALRSSQLQAQSLASMLGNSAASGSSAPQPVSAPAAGGNGGDSGGGSSNASNAAAPRGSLVNLLV
jgi:hypothetical protein